MFSIVEPLSVATPRHVVVGFWFNNGLFELGQDVVVQSVLIITVLNDIELFRVTHNVVLLTAGGHGTPGVHVKVVACHSKPGRCVL